MFNCYCEIFEYKCFRENKNENENENGKLNDNDKINIQSVYQPIFEHNAQYCENCWDFKEKCKCYKE